MRTVLIVIFDGMQSLDLTGPLKVLASASSWCQDRGAGPGYAITTASPGGRAVRTPSGLTVLPDRNLDAEAAGPDLLIVPGGAGARRRDPDLVAWLREHADSVTRLASVCTGAFPLAEAGLLAGRRATTHWEHCAELAAEYPDVDVDPEPIFIRDGNIATSAAPAARRSSAPSRAFLRALGVGPAEYGRRFRPANTRPEETHADRHPAL